MINKNQEGANESELMTMLELNDKITSLKLDQLKLKLKGKNEEQRITELRKHSLTQQQEPSSL